MKINNLSRHLRLVGASAALVMAMDASALGETAEEFYKANKLLNLIVSVQEGAPGTDTVARIVARHMPNHLAGKPTIVVRNMPGAGHLRATNFLYSQAPKDGTHFGLIWPAYVMHQIADGRAANYDAAKFQYIGSTGLSNSTVAVWHTVGVTSIEDAQKREVLMGGTGVGSDTALYPELLNNTLGTKFKVIMGYKGGADIDLAMQRGEIEGRAGAALSTIASLDWIKNKQINVLVQIGERPEPGYENIPMLTSLAKDEQTREVLQVFSYSVALGRPFMAPPEAPADRVALLRTAFMAAMKDPGLLEEFEKGRLDLKPVTGERLGELVDRMVKVDDAVLTRVRAVVNDKAAPPK